MKKINPCPFVISLKDGKPVTLFKFEDFLELVDQHMGFDSARWLREYVEQLDSAANYTTAKIETDLTSYEATLDSNRKAFQDIQAETEAITKVLQGSRIDRKKITHSVREIGTIISNQI
jgi:hypothetical protein